MLLPVILWTDALVFLLLVIVAGYGVHSARDKDLRVQWAKVFRTPAAMSSVVFMLVFVLIGLFDSVHWRPALDAPQASGRTSSTQAAYAPEVRSALDAILSGIASRKERTYSAPLATRAYSKETVSQADGSQGREFPRLRYGGAHLGDNEEGWSADIWLTTLRGVSLALVLWLVAVAVIVVAGGPQRGSINASRQTVRGRAAAIWNGQSDIAWRAALLTLGCVLLIGVPLVMLSAHYHVLGTDKVGQDVLYLSLKSVRTALVIGTLTTLVMLPFAVLLGIMAGYFRGWVDDVIQYLYTTLNSIPGVLLIAAAVLVLQVQIEMHPNMFPTAAQRADFRLLFLCIILGITSWTGLCRLLRGETLKLRELEYVQAARAFGASSWGIMRRHILPNVMHIVLISVVMDFSGLVLAEAVLSYVGVGVDPGMISFGTMINAARLEMGREPVVWWSLASAFAFMLLMVLAANLFADAVRDAFDPRMKSRGSAAGSLPQEVSGV
jgi:peptide/nickel transport system permease protein